MVRVRMGEDKSVDLSCLILPEKRSDHMLSNIETIPIRTAPIDEYLLSPREFNENAVSMSDIDKR